MKIGQQTVGRDTACQEPSKSPYPSATTTSRGTRLLVVADTEFAKRSLEVSAGGYDLTETVSNILDSGVCAVGHKVINGSLQDSLSRFLHNFSDSAGIGAHTPSHGQSKCPIQHLKRTQP